MITVNAKEFRDAVDWAASITRPKALAPWMSQLCLKSAIGRDELDIYAYAGETYLTTRVRAAMQNNDDLDVCVLAKDLKASLKGLKNGLTLSVDSARLWVQNGNVQHALGTTTGKDFPPIPDPQGLLASHQLDAGLFARVARGALTPNSDRPVLEHVFIGNGNLVAADGFRLAVASTPTPPNFVGLIPAYAAKLISGWGAVNVDHWAAEGRAYSWLRLSGEKGTVWCCTSSSSVSYPNYPQLIPTKYDACVLVNRNDTLRALANARPAAMMAGTGLVRLQYIDGKLSLSAGVDDNKVTICVPAGYNGAVAFNIAANARYLEDAFETVDDELLYIEITTSRSPFVVRGAANDALKWIIMPMFVKEGE